MKNDPPFPKFEPPGYNLPKILPYQPQTWNKPMMYPVRRVVPIKPSGEPAVKRSLAEDLTVMDRHESLPQALRTVLHGFSQTSSVPYFSQFTREQSRPKRVVWFFLFVAGLALATYQSWGLILAYFKYQTVQTSLIRLNSSFAYPAITFCNMNPVLWTEAQKLNHSVYTREEKRFAEMMAELNVSLPILKQRNIRENILLDVMWKMWVEDEDMREVISQSRKDLSIICLWNRLTYCNDSDFIEFYHPYYGVCFTFNPGVLEDREAIFTEPGRDVLFGFFMNDTEEFPYLSRGTAAVLYLHQPGTPPIFSKTSVHYIYPNVWGHLKVSLTTISRLPFPYPSACVEKEDEHLRKQLIYYSEERKYLYSAEACRITCLQRQNIENCGCINPNYPSLKIDIPVCGIPLVCSLDSSKVNWTVCECPDTCTEAEYGTVMTYEQDFINAVYWHDAAKWRLIKDMRDHYHREPNVTKEVMMKNLAVIQVYYSSPLYEEVTERPMTSMADLLGALGGNMGFWTGISMTAVFEIIELFMALIFRLMVSVQLRYHYKRRERFRKVRRHPAHY